MKTKIENPRAQSARPALAHGPRTVGLAPKAESPCVAHATRRARRGHHAQGGRSGVSGSSSMVSEV
jgi:hypothetical protein